MLIRRRPSAEKVMGVLAACNLPGADISEAKLEHFFACGAKDAPGGIVGLELYGDVALLRSLAVEKEARKQGCGRRLVQEAERHARQSGVKRLYLLTTTAEAFFAALGYARMSRASVPDPILATTEFQSLCPASAAVMEKRL